MPNNENPYFSPFTSRGEKFIPPPQTSSKTNARAIRPYSQKDPLLSQSVRRSHCLSIDKSSLILEQGKSTENGSSNILISPQQEKQLRETRGDASREMLGASSTQQILNTNDHLKWKYRQRPMVQVSQHTSLGKERSSKRFTFLNSPPGAAAITSRQYNNSVTKKQ